MVRQIAIRIESRVRSQDSTGKEEESFDGGAKLAKNWGINRQSGLPVS